LELEAFLEFGLLILEPFMKSPLAYLAILALWACLYLPGLGSREIRGEEWRRTIPGRTMLNTGEWIVPYSGGLPYIRKPPLINWVSAASFSLAGAQTEWAARIPSVLLMLGAALGIYAFARRALGGGAALLGAVFFLTCIGCLEKGRIAEIEVYYIALTGLAFSAWLAGFMGALNRWVSWLAAGFFLGLAMLAKGPMHLFFFYALVVGACWKTKRLRELRSPAHLAGFALCLAIFLAWALPFFQQYGRLIEQQPWLVQTSTKGADVPPSAEPPMGAFATWRHELASRVTGEEETSTKDWLVRGPRALVMFLPWALFLPLWWRKEAMKQAFGDDATLALYRGLSWGAVAAFAVMVLLPSSSPRYVAPLLGPVTLMLGWLVSRRRLPLPADVGLRWRPLLVFGVALAAAGWALVMFMWWGPLGAFSSGSAMLVAAISGACVAHLVLRRVWQAAAPGARVLVASLLLASIVGLGLAIEPMLHKSDDIRSTGSQISRAMEPKDAPLHVFHLGQVPYVFYLPVNSIESYDLPQLPDSGVRWMLTTVKVDVDFRPLFERRYGQATKIGEWTGGWGASDQDINRHMVLLRFAGR